jgi:hypothetical protein
VSVSKVDCSNVPKSSATANPRLSPVTPFQPSAAIRVVDGCDTEIVAANGGSAPIDSRWPSKIVRSRAISSWQICAHFGHSADLLRCYETAAVLQPTTTSLILFQDSGRRGQYIPGDQAGAPPRHLATSSSDASPRHVGGGKCGLPDVNDLAHGNGGRRCKQASLTSQHAAIVTRHLRVVDH